MSVQSVTLVHLSDVHLGPLPRTPLALLNAKRVTGALNWYYKRRRVHLPEVASQIARDAVALRADHIAVTGDIANLGLPSEIVRGADWLARLGPPDRVCVVPGNHDIYSTVRHARLGAAALAPWTDYFAPCTTGAGYGDGSTFPYVRIIGDGALRVALIGLNTAVETPPFVATGLLGHVQIEALTRILDATRRDGLVRVVMLHHPPLPGLARPHHELTDAPALVDALRHHGAELIIHGHNHRHMIAALQTAHGPLMSVGVPSASAARPRAGEHLARSHVFQFSRDTARAAVKIRLVARGLAERGGAVVELEQRELTSIQ